MGYYAGSAHQVAKMVGGNRYGNGNNKKGGIPAHIAERNGKRKEAAK